MYTLISAPVLGFDLTRMEGGAATAELLETMLAVPAQGWAAAVDHLPAESPAQTVTREITREFAGSLAELRPSVRDLPGQDPASAVGLLQRAPIGTLAGLLQCVRTDVLLPDRDLVPPVEPVAPAEPVVAIATDAVCATYLRELLGDDDRRVLAAPWLAMRRHLPVTPPDLGPQHREVNQLLTAVRSLNAGGIRALASAADRMRAETADWSTAMHSMTWAVHMSARVRAAATAQLRLVQAVDLAGIPVSDRAAGVWNLLSGALQALLVRDLADSESAQQLLAPAVGALGPGWLIED
ncbi:hypothetical protein [Actinophytocola xanthii]|uniref:Uncharacterized protein n=1 Tax=Actinophytocola xanthii TaxID=1912961 RepID=A0A1Q8BXQ6_9PSEU|nr:hypothetical protein [Actinophytocola xanthii]OLF06891.1 hypothetical protein BU204_36020 [Actinophytocola xanthii]